MDPMEKMRMVRGSAMESPCIGADLAIAILRNSNSPAVRSVLLQVCVRCARKCPLTACWSVVCPWKSGVHVALWVVVRALVEGVVSRIWVRLLVLKLLCSPERVLLERRWRSLVEEFDKMGMDWSGTGNRRDVSV